MLLNYSDILIWSTLHHQKRAGFAVSHSCPLLPEFFVGLLLILTPSIDNPVPDCNAVDTAGLFYS